MVAAQRTAVASRSSSGVAVKFKASDRFGDEPLKQPPKRESSFGGTAPPGSLMAYEYRPEDGQLAKRIGSCPTQVESWRLSEPGGPVAVKNASRRPNPEDYVLDLGPARYSPEKSLPTSGGRPATRFPIYTIGGSGPRLAPPPNASADLMYSLPKTVGNQRQPLAGVASAAAASFAHNDSSRTLRPMSSLEDRVGALEVLKKVHTRKPVTPDERQRLLRDRRTDHEAGRATSQSYMPRSTFDRAMAPSRSSGQRAHLASARI